MRHPFTFTAILIMCVSQTAFDEADANLPPGYNYDENQVPEYTLPDPLISESGQVVAATSTWENLRRPEILRQFQNHVYGQTPEWNQPVGYEIVDQDANALNGQAYRKQVKLFLLGQDHDFSVDLLIYLPAEAEGPVPIFLGLNFYGNHTIHPDPAILIPGSWSQNNQSFGITNHQPTDKSRGVRAHRWPVEMILKAGFGLATIYYGDIDPDFDDGFHNGIHPHFGSNRTEQSAGSISTWAWALSRTIDYFAQDKQIAEKQVVVIGHSRLGKTSLWAGAIDQRFAIVISNDSGCGGAALSRRRFGETVARINNSFPHWFCGDFKKYNDHEAALPVDQHQLMALIAPRPVYVASAAEDLWADPQGEFLSLKHADPVYQLYGLQGIGVEQQPKIDQPVMKHNGYHIRSGKHDLTSYDWQQYLKFATRHFQKNNAD